MSSNILVTGAAGYIGGSVLEHLLHADDPLKKANLYATVRSREQLDSLSKLQVTAIVLDMNDQQAVIDAVLHNKIDILINTVASFNPAIVSNMITALGERRKESGQPVHFVHSGVINIFAAEAGWTFGPIEDSGPIYEREKEWQTENPVRDTDLLVVEQSKAQGVTSVNVLVPSTYGTGSGQGNKLSVQVPSFIRTSIADRTVHKFDVDSSQPWTHISDLSALYGLLIENILQRQTIPTGEKGYYFAGAHRGPQWKVAECIAKSLHERGLISEPRSQIWPSDEVAAEKLGFPAAYLRAMVTSNGGQTPVNAFRLGWKPTWDERRFLESIDDEVQAVIDLDTGKTGLFKTLNTV